MTSIDGLLGSLLSVPALPGARCRGHWALMDEAQPGEPAEVVQARHAQGLTLCRGCPALQPCRDYVDSLPPAKRPAGVIAGEIRTWSTTTRKTRGPRKDTSDA